MTITPPDIPQLAQTSQIRPPNRLIRGLGFVLGMLCSGVVGMGLFIHLRFDPVLVETMVVQTISARYARDLQIDGVLQLKLWPRPSLYVGNASLSEANSDKRFASWQSAVLQLDLWALLQKDYRITHADIDGLNLDLEHRSKTGWNFTDLLQTPYDNLALNTLRLRNSHWIIDNDKSNAQTWQLQNLQLRSGPLRVGQNGTLQLDAQVDIDGKPATLQITSDYQFSAPGSWRLSRSDAVLQSATDTPIELQLPSWPEKQALHKLQARLDQLSWQASTNADDKTIAPLQWALQRGELALTQAANATPLHWALEDAKGSRDAWQAAKLDAQLPEAQLIAQALHGNPLQADAKLEINWYGSDKQHKVQANGSWHWERTPKNDKTPATWRFVQSTPAKIQLQHAIWQNKQIEASWQGSVSGQSDSRHAQFDVQVQHPTAGSLNFTGRLQTDTDNQWQLNGKLSSGVLPLDTVLSPFQTAPFSGLSQLWPELNLDLNLDLQALKLYGLQIDRARARLQRDNKGWQVTEQSVQAYDGTLNGELRWQSATQQLKITQALRDVELATLSADSGLQLPFSGRSNATLEATRSGPLDAATCPQLQGVLRFYGKAITWQNLALIPEAGPHSALRELSANFSLNAGQFKAEKLNFQSGTTRLSGQGSIDCQGQAAIKLDGPVGAQLSGDWRALSLVHRSKN